MLSENPHYTRLEECLLHEAISIMQGQEDRGLTVRNARTMALNDDEYRQFLDEFYFASKEVRTELLKICIQSVASNAQAVLLISQVRQSSRYTF